MARELVTHLFVLQLRVCEEQRALWESRQDELEQSVQEGEEKADQLEK